MSEPDPIKPPRPQVFDLDEPAADPSLAPPVPDLVPQASAMLAVAALARPRSAGGRLAIWVFSALFSFVLSVAAWDFVTGLFDRSPLLGWLAFVLTGLAVLLLAIYAAREWAAFARLWRLDG